MAARPGRRSARRAARRWRGSAARPRRGTRRGPRGSRIGVASAIATMRRTREGSAVAMPRWAAMMAAPCRVSRGPRRMRLVRLGSTVSKRSNVAPWPAGRDTASSRSGASCARSAIAASTSRLGASTHCRSSKDRSSGPESRARRMSSSAAASAKAGGMTAAEGLAMPKSSENAGATTDTTAASGPLAAVRRAAVAAALSCGGSLVSEAR